MTLSAAVIPGLAASLSLAPASPGCSLRPDVAEGDLPEVLVMVDGLPTELALEEISDLDAESVEIVCWLRAERLFGAMVRSGVVSVWTKPGPFLAISSDLNDLISAQQIFRSERGEYAGDVSLLAFEASPSVSVELTKTPEGWTAVFRRERWNSQCSFTFRSVPDGPTSAQTDEVRPTCVSLHDHRGSG